MRWNRKRRALLQDFEQRVGEHFSAMSDRVADVQHRVSEASDRVESAVQAQWSMTKIAVTAACVMGGLAVLAGGLYAGNELRTRYKVKRRTPYDYYAHAGDRRRQTDMDSVVGI